MQQIFLSKFIESLGFQIAEGLVERAFTISLNLINGTSTSTSTIITL